MREETKPFTAALTGKAAILAAFCALAASAVEVQVDFAKDVRPVESMKVVIAFIQLFDNIVLNRSVKITLDSKVKL